ncbi:MAG: PAS domain S-box protein [Candidatus Cloacimonetes bacterium]|nr:PAS domain S-box protein [Candidatus Cloacimonadota bacterium]
MSQNDFSSLTKKQLLEKIESLEAELEAISQKKYAHSEIRFKNLLENLPECVWSYTFSSRKYYVSPSITKILGYTQEEFTSDPFFAYRKLHPNYVELVDKAWIELYENKKLFTIQYPVMAKNGKYVWIEENVFRIYPKDGQIHAEGLFRDVTAQREENRIQKILFNIANAVNITKDLNDLYQRIQNELTKVFDTTNFFIVLYDKKTETFSQPYIVDEKENLETFPVGKTLTYYVIRTGKPFIGNTEKIKTLANSGDIEFFGFPSKIWLGVPLKIKDEVIGVVSVQSYEDENAFSIRDLEVLQFVSEQVSISIHRKRAEEKLIKSKEENSLILRAMPDILFQMSSQGKFIDYKGSERSFHIEPEKFIGKNITDVMSPEIAKITIEGIKKALETNEIISYEYFLQTHKGPGYFETRTVKSSHNSVLSIVRNITKRKLAEEKIKKALEEKDILLQEIHHRVKNNLQVIYSMLRLQADTISDENALKYIIDSQNRVKSMALVHEKLFQSKDFSHIEMRTYFQSLTRHLISSMKINRAQVSLIFICEDIFLNMDTAVPLGIIINEVFSNILTQQSKIFKKCLIKIILDTNDNSIYKFAISCDINLNRISDKTDNRKSFSIKLIDTLSKQLDGKFSFHSEEGIYFQLEFHEQK